MNYNFIENKDEISIDTEKKNNFYRPAVKSIEMYRQRVNEKWAKVSKMVKRACTNWSLLAMVGFVGTVASCHA